MSDFARVIWETQENTKAIAALNEEVKALRTQLDECRLKHDDDQQAISAITRILDRVVETVELNQNLLEKRVQHIEGSSSVE